MRVAQKLFIKTYGCQMNAYDSARMAEILAPLGFVAAAAAAEADLVILNTCHIREKAVEKVYSELGKVRALKARKARRGEGGMLIAIAGCLRGFQCGNSSSAVGDAATQAVVMSIVMIVVACGLFAVVFNFLGI